MDDIKKPKPDCPVVQADNSLLSGLCDAGLLQLIHDHYQNLGSSPAQVAVALSGGVDSAVLALHLSVWARQHKVLLHCFHVHHGLQAVADTWQSHVHALASLLGTQSHSLQVDVDLGQGDGMESAARNARYSAFKQMAGQTGVEHIFLGHHQDDQAETVLLRLLRGAGPTGLGAMAPQSQRDGIVYLRPWLQVARSRLLAVGEQMGRRLHWHAVSDATNYSDDYTRGAVRERLTPQLNERWVGWQKVLVRHAQLSREAGEVLAEAAQSDLSTLDYCVTDTSFSLKHWRELSTARQALVIRYWLGQAGLKMPTEARLNDLMRQMRQLHALGFDRKMKVKHGSHFVVCTRGRVYLQHHNETVSASRQT
ncbi:tRNA lysidine(34) synthetase TilS [Paenalcaligenes niemegkensis]|uniref:tRNA lysidine(34) synthetase TilS n=1 Tax=Paenalcaligenes niemegkensis TaxID=2895469 RepID=UPI001EE86D6D|nr:tRNA lysidine(34) synthetase TilS [Paenalcaligenes niemegkensis]MCQ9615741.1 tRNA lysidine(34) synthetase TilS [Paenalcaligenes niemegkensis]